MEEQVLVEVVQQRAGFWRGRRREPGDRFLMPTLEATGLTWVKIVQPDYAKPITTVTVEKRKRGRKRVVGPFDRQETSGFVRM